MSHFKGQLSHKIKYSPFMEFMRPYRVDNTFGCNSMDSGSGIFTSLISSLVCFSCVLPIDQTVRLMHRWASFGSKIKHPGRVLECCTSRSSMCLCDTSEAKKGEDLAELFDSRRANISFRVQPLTGPQPNRMEADLVHVS